MWKSARLAACAALLAALTGGHGGAAPAAAQTSARQTALASLVEPTSVAYTPDPSWWVTNGRVTDILPSGDRVYLSGGFDYVGPSTGYGVQVAADDGARSSTAPVVDGPVDAAVPDGSGGWYIAGRFTRVGEVYRQGAAQINSNGGVTGWNPRPVGRVLALATTPQTVLLGGEFTTLATASRPASGLATVDRNKGNVLTSWAFSANGRVRTLAESAGVVYVGGDFSVVNGSSRRGLAKVDASSGDVDAAFVGQVAGSVRSAALSGDGSALYVGGEFASVSAGSSSVARSRLAAFSTDTGVPTAWTPAASATVNAVAVDPATETVFVGGQFSTVAGLPRAKIAGLTPGGAATGFLPGLNGCHTRHTTGYARTNPPCATEVVALAVSAGVLYVGGRFGRSGSTTRHDAAAYRIGTGALTGWNPVAGDVVTTIAVTAGRAFVGGEFTSLGGAVRKGVAALDAHTGELDPTLTADTDNQVLDLALSADGARLYLAGSFQTVQGQVRSKMAAVVVATGAVDPQFRPAFNNDVLSIAASRGVVFAGGQFTSVSGISRSHMVKLHGTTGAVITSFRADTVGPSGALRSGGMVQSLAVSPDGGRVYVAGPFLTVNGQSRPGGLAVVYGLTGALHPRQLGGVLGCSTHGPWINRLQLSSDGMRLYGGDVCPDNIYQWDAVNLSTSSNPTGLKWRTWCNGGMQGALELGGRFYYGTHGNACLEAPGSSQQRERPRFAVFDSASGRLASDNPTFNSAMGIWSVGATNGGLLVGGDFTEANGALRQGLAYLPFTGGEPTTASALEVARTTADADARGAGRGAPLHPRRGR